MGNLYLNKKGKCFKGLRSNHPLVAPPPIHENLKKVGCARRLNNGNVTNTHQCNDKHIFVKKCTLSVILCKYNILSYLCFYVHIPI